MKKYGFLFLLIFVSFQSNAALVKVEFESVITDIYVATPVNDSYEYKKNLLYSDIAGARINLNDLIVGTFYYDTNSIETQSSKNNNDPTYASYYALKSFELNVGNIFLSSPDDNDYLAIYDNLSGTTDVFYSSGSYRDVINFNIFDFSLFADQNLWNNLSIPNNLDLNDFYYKKISGAFLPNANDLHLNWSGTLNSLQVTVVPEPSTFYMMILGLFIFGLKSMHNKKIQRTV